MFVMCGYDSGNFPSLEEAAKKLGFKKYEGNVFDSEGVENVCLEGQWFALVGWNGEQHKAFPAEVTIISPQKVIAQADTTNPVSLVPVYASSCSPNEDEEAYEQSMELVGFKINIFYS